MSKLTNFIKTYNECIVILLLSIGLIFGYLQLKQNAKDNRYRYLAETWNDIMSKSIELPEFNNKSKTLTYKKAFDENKLNQYETYARWIGGFVEDLYINKYYKTDLYYEPWIETVLNTHETWFIDHINYYKYTPRFYERLLDIKNKSGMGSIS